MKKLFRRVFSETRNRKQLYNLFKGAYELAISPENLISGEYFEGKFIRYDAIVRYMTAKGYLENPDYDFSFYNRMQKARGVEFGSQDRYKELIDNVRRFGFDYKSSIVVKSDGRLKDGSHRLALSLCMDVPLLTTSVNWKSISNVEYGIEWFRNNGFSSEECFELEEVKHKLFMEKGLYFSIILWPPVIEHFDEIQKDIPYNIISSKDYAYDNSTFEKVIRNIYSIDDIADWKVDKKIEFMDRYPKNIRALWVEFPDPEYRKKKANNADISVVGEKLKKLLREKYKTRVSNYIYDIVCHSSDNWQHNKKIMKILAESVKI